MSPTKRPHSAALRYLQDQLIGDDSARQESLAAERVNADIARTIYILRQGAGLTQADLARLAHTTASVISRLEDADYAGHSLSMLRRLAAALHRQVQVSFVPLPGAAPPKPRRRAPTRARRTTVPVDR